MTDEHPAVESAASLKQLLGHAQADVRVHCLRIQRNGDLLRLTHKPPLWKAGFVYAVGLPLCGALIAAGVWGTIEGTRQYLELGKTVEGGWQQALLHWVFLVWLLVVNCGLVITTLVLLDLLPRHLDVDLKSGQGRFRQFLRRGVAFDAQPIAWEIVANRAGAHLCLAVDGRSRRLPVWCPTFAHGSQERAVETIESVTSGLSEVLPGRVEVTDRLSWERFWI